jgi:copper chaperone
MIELRVSGITCEGCVRSVTRAIGKAAPGAPVTVDLASGTVSVDAGIDPAGIVEAVRRAGYEAELRDQPAS